MARAVGRLSVGERRYGAPQLQPNDELSTVHTSPLGQVKPLLHAASHGAGIAHRQNVDGEVGPTLTAWQAAPETHVPPQVGYAGFPPQSTGVHEALGFMAAHAKPFGQSAPPNPHGPGDLHSHPRYPPKIGRLRTGSHDRPLGHAPPHTGAPGLPHGVLPVGRHTQPGNGPGPTAAHSSPTGHVPLHAGPVSPHGELGEMQAQPESVAVHMPSPEHVPPHAGDPLASQAGGRPFMLASEQSTIASAVACDPTNAPATSLRTVGPAKRAQFRSVLPVVIRMPTAPSGAASGRPASLATILSVRPCRSSANRRGEIPAGASPLRNL
jgi:hypothetical protein